MNSLALRALLAAACLGAAVPAPALAANPGCVIAVEEADPMRDRAGLLAQYERLPAHCLKAILHECGAVASRSLLDFGSAAMCSIGYEALLKQGFNGNFQALLAWWRSERPEPPAR
jgi:hypothetical protein